MDMKSTVNILFIKKYKNHCNNYVLQIKTKPQYRSGSHTRGVSIGCAVVEDAKSSCCRLWI